VEEFLEEVGMAILANAVERGPLLGVDCLGLQFLHFFHFEKVGQEVDKGAVEAAVDFEDARAQFLEVSENDEAPLVFQDLAHGWVHVLEPLQGELIDLREQANLTGYLSELVVVN